MLILCITPIKFVIYLQHCAGINCLAVLKSTEQDGRDYLFTGSRDGTLKRWALQEDSATFCSTFESHVDWVQAPFVFGLVFCMPCSYTLIVMKVNSY